MQQLKSSPKQRGPLLECVPDRNGSSDQVLEEDDELERDNSSDLLNYQLDLATCGKEKGQSDRRGAGAMDQPSNASADGD